MTLGGSPIKPYKWNPPYESHVSIEHKPFIDRKVTNESKHLLVLWLQSLILFGRCHKSFPWTVAVGVNSTVAIRMGNPRGLALEV